MLQEVLKHINTSKDITELLNINKQCCDRINLLRSRECAEVAVSLIPNVTKVKLKDNLLGNRTYHLKGKVALVTKVNQKTVKIVYDEKEVPNMFNRKWTVNANMLDIVA